MAGMLPFLPVAPVAGTGQSAGQQQHPPTKWWSPLFGFSSEADYISNPAEGRGTTKPADGTTTSAAARFAPGGFTEEKARLLRRVTCDAASYHSTMYHSAIASRLASDFSDRTTVDGV